MAIEVVRPAPFLAAVDLLRASGATKPHLARVATWQTALGTTFGFVDEEGRLLAVLGFWPLGGAREEVFLVGLPPSVVGPRLVELHRRARLIIARRMQSGIGRIIGHVRIGHEPGRRLARLVGFRPCDDGAPPGLEAWVRENVDAGAGAVQ